MVVPSLDFFCGAGTGSREIVSDSQTRRTPPLTTVSSTRKFAMSYGDVEARPAKKRRFFVDDVDEPALNPEPSLPDEPKPPSFSDEVAKSPIADADSSFSFDADSLQALIGERLSDPELQRLREHSGGSLEQGSNLTKSSWRQCC